LAVFVAELAVLAVFEGRGLPVTVEHTASLFTPSQAARRWRVALADGEVRTVEAMTFRVEGGALVLAQAAGCAAAYAPGTWLRIESEET